ncbi:hypothetical protein KIN34_11325 [Cellulomonas sp. DKR-3]|uniref:DUF3040 domain-containing protein n=1 Tax=Cellulomonas fulva TaxID=2835530 RepID=A0ABS5U0K2_9CELL|nr:hypothetical protein [Cellulomonas fulva]MBT0994872.1 hypothetical protein [Cellulomonas fulva]
MAARSDGPDDGPVDDERWARIVAELGDLDSSAGTGAPPAGIDFPVAPGVASPFDGRRVVRPAHEGRQEDGPHDGADGRTDDRTDGRARRDELAAPSASGRDWDGTSQYDEAEDAIDEAERFVPPDPGPVLGGDPLLTMAWFAAAGMPLFLVVVLIAWRDAPSAIVQAACVVFVLGVGVLLWRMPQRRDRDDDDTGAVV